MPIPYSTNTLQPKGELEFKEINASNYIVIFTPSIDVLPPNATNPENYKRPILNINLPAKLLTTYPFQVWGMLSMTNKYTKLYSISFDIDWYPETYVPDADNIQDFLSSVIPNGFTIDYNFGLGFSKNYRSILSILEGFEFKKLYVTTKGQTKIDFNEKQATFNRSDFTKLTTAINQITQKAQKVSSKLKKETISDLFIKLLDDGAIDKTNLVKASELAKMIGTSTRLLTSGATKKEQKEAIEVIKKNSRRIISEQPEELVKLRNDIELVTLEDLIRKFEDLIGKKISESHWQNLFNENPFILTMAFGIPVTIVKEQASLGGTTISGSGNKIADYLVRNSISNNAAIVEIKTPATKLINPKVYRGGIFAPSTEVTAAVNQILDQVYHFQNHFISLKNTSREAHLESYSVQGILIAGRFPNKLDEQKSFELFRGNSKNIQIVTFDELLKKLKDLHSFLNSKYNHIKQKVEEKEGNQNETDDLPF